MSRYFPHAPYAEDQPLARTILTTHVATRAVTMGTLIGVGITGARTVIPALRPKTALPQAFAARLLRSCASSIVVTLGVTGLALVGRMWGREAIEWQDRSWRLMENRGQLETDDWTYGGMGAATAAALLVMARAGGEAKKPAVAVVGWRGVVGAAGLGSVGGMMGYLGWRYAVNGGKFSETLAKKEERTGL
ncbi:hypothetical protein LEL_07612 [Akanthomyces lecanii RCEF 1005]|uniref:Uncharacterized protein n=1 Tax=Akanthomyces lecanii RCEF 1005 TaxID=1081108 RepID=A0A168FU76_CORDF|nr:hypothetical protein LEL_07612 [Akanthomyces lecanii RCEF 1005]